MGVRICLDVRIANCYFLDSSEWWDTQLVGFVHVHGSEFGHFRFFDTVAQIIDARCVDDHRSPTFISGSRQQVEMPIRQTLTQADIGELATGGVGLTTAG